MTKSAQMTIKVEPELRDQFREAALESHQPAAQIIRNFMRTYSEKKLNEKYDEIEREIFKNHPEFDLTEEEEYQGVLEALESIERGEVISNEKVMEWLDSLGTDNPLECPGI